MFIELQDTAFTRSMRVNGGTSFQLIGTIGSSVITFEQPDGLGGWTPIIIDGTTQELSATNTIVSFFMPVLMRCNKPVTTGTAGVMMVS